MMNQIVDDILSPDVTLIGAVFKLLLSLVLGAAVGFERHRKGQIAGLRTFALICMGATLAMLISIFIPQEYLGVKNGDPGRIAAQVVSGVGFLGAGAIIQMKGSVRGLTTAAGIWMTACIGLAVGAGMYAIATVATFLIIFILLYIERYEKWCGLQWESKIVRIKVHGIVADTMPLREVFKRYGVHTSDEFFKFDYDSNITVINYLIRVRDAADFIALFNDIHKCYDTASITLGNEVSM